MSQVPSPKIAFIIYQSENQSNGGVESITQILCRLSSWKRYVITNLETHKNHVWKRNDISIIILAINPSNSIVRKLINILRLNYQTYNYLKSHQIALVHCNDIQSVLTSGLGAKLAGCKIVFNIRDVKAAKQSYGIKWKYARWLSDQLLVLSQEMKEAILHRLSVKDTDRVDYCYSIVDFDKFKSMSKQQIAETKKQLNIPDDRSIIGMVAAVMPKKQQLAFITQAIPELITKFPELLIYFIGDLNIQQDEYAKQCYSAYRMLGLENNIHFLGYRSHIEQWYPMFDLTVIASEREGLARCMIESISCGTPAVSFDVCSAIEILQEHHCGFVVNQGDYKHLVDKISQVLANKALRDKLSINGINTSRELFTQQKVMDFYNSLYKKLLK